MRNLALALLPIALAAVDPAAWPVATDIDPATPSPLDLRRLNEAVAGAGGPIRSAGDELVLADGSPLRVWGVSPMDTGRASDADLARHARFLARIGVNMVRLGGADSGIVPQQPGQAFTDVNPAWVAMVHRTVAAMKREGIYTRISPVWDHGSIKHIGEDWGLDGYHDGMGINGLIFFEPHLQAAWKAWMRHLLTVPGPDGQLLRDEPALAIIQVVSEDTLFFWWTDKIAGGPRAELERQFAAWAARRHGDLGRALAAWGGGMMDGDQPESGRLAIQGIYALTQAKPGDARANAQVAFFAETERAWIAEARRFLRDELGFRGLVGPSNFPGVDQERLGDAQRWAWSAGDVIEQNDFFSGPHEGPNCFWRIDAGDTYRPRSALRDPVLPTSRRQVAGKPFILSSTNWIFPNPYQAEGPILNAAYGAMQGLDGVLWFTAGSVAVDGAPHLPWAVVNGSQAMFKWTISHPAQIGMFPAAALIFRQRLIDVADTVVHDERSADQVLARLPATVADGGMGAVTPTPSPARDATAGPQAFLQGRVEVAFADHPGESRSAVRPAGPLQTSTHGQLRLDSAKGVLLLDAPKVQGAVGFLKGADAQRMTDLTVTSAMDYAAVVAVPLDGQPLARSAEVLVQVGSVIRPSGWTEQPAADPSKGISITATGTMPWLAPATQVAIALRNPGLRTAQVLDLGGRVRTNLRLTTTPEGVTLEFPADAMYVVLAR